MRGRCKKKTAAALAAMLVMSSITVPAEQVLAEETWVDAPVLTFTDEGITSSGETEAGYTIQKTALTITASGTYVLQGSCADGSIEVEKKLKDVVLVLDGLDLAASSIADETAGTTKAPLVCGKNTSVEIVAAAGTENTLSDTANNTDEKAVVKAKSSSSLTFSGTGTLNILAQAKNGIKGAAETEIVVKEQTLNITSKDNALASDHSVTVNSGTITIASEEGDGIKAEPDAEDTVSEGNIYINGGRIQITKSSDGIQAAKNIIMTNGECTIVSDDNAVKAEELVQVDNGTMNLTAGGDGIKASNASSVSTETDSAAGTETDAGTTADDAAAEGSTTDGNTTDGSTTEGDTAETAAVGDVLINGGAYHITSAGDALQAEQNLTIQDGTFEICTNGGSDTVLSDSSDSCKGLKAGNELTVNGGTYTIDSADDAVHSDAYVTVNDGNFTIRTGDDGMHADTSLIVGQETGSVQPVIDVQKSYEGLEAGTVYVNGGDIDVVSSDDGINAAGGSGSGSSMGQPGGPGGDGFNPGGGRPGGQPGGRASLAAETSSDYAIYMNGGDIFINAGGDGLDSNGDLILNGGKTIVYGAAPGGQGSDNTPLDSDGEILINGGEIFGAGSSQMVERPSSSSPQNYILLTNTTYNADTILNIVDQNNQALFTETLLKKANYIFYTSPAMTASGSYSVKTGKLSTGETAGGSGSTAGGSTEGSGSTSGGSTEGSGSTAGGSTEGSGSTAGGSTEGSGSIAGGSGNTAGGSTEETGNGAVTGGTAEGSETAGTQSNPADTVPVGTKLKDTKKKVVYIVTGTAKGKETVAYAGTTDKKATKITIPGTVLLGSTRYQVTSIADKALYNNKKITKLTIGSNVKKIGKKAFYNAKKLKSITVKTKKLTTKTVGAKAFAGTAKNAVVKVPGNKVKAYKKLFAAKGLYKKVSVRK